MHRFSSQMASYNAASNICRALYTGHAIVFLSCDSMMKEEEDSGKPPADRTLSGSLKTLSAVRSLRQHLPYNRQPRIMIISNELTPEKAQANGSDWLLQPPMSIDTLADAVHATLAGTDPTKGNLPFKSLLATSMENSGTVELGTEQRDYLSVGRCNLKPVLKAPGCSS